MFRTFETVETETPARSATSFTRGDFVELFTGTAYLPRPKSACEAPASCAGAIDLSSQRSGAPPEELGKQPARWLSACLQPSDSAA